MMGEVDECLDAMGVKFTSCFTYCIVEDYKATPDFDSSA